DYYCQVFDSSAKLF
nr:immunoglobulin light chain junction region [Macaca mulatta]